MFLSLYRGICGGNYNITIMTTAVKVGGICRSWIVIVKKQRKK